MIKKIVYWSSTCVRTGATYRAFEDEKGNKGNSTPDKSLVSIWLGWNFFNWELIKDREKWEVRGEKWNVDMAISW